MKQVRIGSVISTVNVLLKLAWYGSIAVMLVLVAALLVLGVFTPGILPETISSSFTVRVPGLEIVFDEYTASSSMFLYFIGSIIPFLGLAMFIIYELQKIFATLSSGDPFLRDNGFRVRKIGFAVIVWTLVEGFTSFLTGAYIMNSVAVAGVELNARFSVNITLIFVGLVIIALAEVFRIGFELREDQKLTV